MALIPQGLHCHGPQQIIFPAKFWTLNSKKLIIICGLILIAWGPLRVKSLENSDPITQDLKKISIPNIIKSDFLDPHSLNLTQENNEIGTKSSSSDQNDFKISDSSYDKKSVNNDPNHNNRFNGTIGSGKRIKRNLLTNNGLGGTTNSLEGLLASCQLTNLLMYQLLQQRANPGGTPAGVNNGGLLQSFPLGGGGPGPGPFLPQMMDVLSTYVSTKTFLTKMSSTDVITIPLLFGNKPSPTTVTRTKTFEVTTTELVTLTSTIRPTFSMPVVASPTVAPSATFDVEPEPSSTTEYGRAYPARARDLGQGIQEEENELQGGSGSLRNSRIQPSHIATPILQDEFFSGEQYIKPKFTEPQPPPQKRRKSRTKPSQDQNVAKSSRSYYNYEEPSSPAYKYGSLLQNQPNFTPRDQVVVRNYRGEFYPPDGQEALNQDDYSNNKFYARRLKRRGEAEGPPGTNSNPRAWTEPGFDEPMILDREYLLEPSYDADGSYNFPSTYEKCPPAKEITITKTVTKFVNPPADSSVDSRSFGSGGARVPTENKENSRAWSSGGNSGRGEILRGRRGGKRGASGTGTSSSTRDYTVRPSAATTNNYVGGVGVVGSSSTNSRRGRSRYRDTI